MENSSIITIFNEEEISKKVKELGETITEDYKDKDLVLIGNLKGGFIFLADLCREIMDERVAIDFVQTIGYRGDIDIRSKIIIKRGAHDLDVPIENKHVLLVDDIVDTGRTLSLLKKTFAMKGVNAASIKTCTFINKHERRETTLIPDYYGFNVLEGFVLGYGMALGDKYRSLKGIHSFKKNGFNCGS